MVRFDGEWQGKFHDLDEALEWAREVCETNRLVLVVERRIIRQWKLIAVFPEDRFEDGNKLWRALPRPPPVTFSQ
jgi:hypothetical protein